MKKIGLITEPLNAKGCGIKTYTQSVVKELLRSYKEDYEFVSINYLRNEEVEEIEQVIIDNPFEKLWKTYMWYPYMYRKLDKLGLDLVHFFDQVPTFFKIKTKSIITVHDLSPILYPKSHKRGKCLDYKLLLGRTLRNASKIISVSNNTKEDIVDLYRIKSEKIKTIYEGCSDEFRVLEEDEKLSFNRKHDLPDKFLFVVGNIEPRKNLSRIIEAFDKASISDDYHLLIAGAKGWKYSSVFEAFKKAKKKDRIKFVGYVDFNDLVYYYNLASLLVYPSLYEGFGLPIIEAMNCGCPVLTSNISSMKEVGGEAAILVDPHFSEEIATGIGRLNDVEFINNLKKKQSNWVKQFSWEKAVKETVEVYKDLLSS